MKKLYFFLFASLPLCAAAQHHGAHRDTTEHQHHVMRTPMSHAFSLSLPMTRNASGTAWLPDSTAMYGTA